MQTQGTALFHVLTNIISPEQRTRFLTIQAGFFMVKWISQQ